MRQSPKSRLSKTVTVFSAFALGLAGPLALAQAPAGTPITEDSQVAFSISGTNVSFSGPRGVAVAPDGTIYVADQTNKRVIRVTTTNGGVLSTGGNVTGAGTALAPSGTGVVTLGGPTAVAVDSGGVLYIADASKNQVVKMTAPETSNTATAITYGTSSRSPVALAVDPTTRDLYIADSSTANLGIYKVAFVGGAITKLTLSATSLKPIGLAVDSASNLYFADATNNEIFKRTAAGVNSVYLSIATGNFFTFKFSAATAPIGMNFDALGNMYVLDNGAAADHLFEIAPTTPTPLWYLVPISKLGTGTLTSISIALDSIGNILLTDDGNNTLDYIYYNNPVNFGSVDAGTTTPQVTANYQFNTAAASTPVAFQTVQGDYTGEFSVTTATCLNPTTPLGTTTGTVGEQTCTNKYDATYQSSTPGFRAGSVGFTDGTTTNNILAVQANAIDVAGAIAIYPGSQSILASSTTLYEPQGLAITGDGTNLFVADEGGDFSQNPVTYTHGAVYQYPITGGAISGTAHTISGTTTPMGVALDAAGDLYVADYNGKIYVVQPTQSATTHLLSWNTAAKPLTLTGVTLDHPMAITVDPSGNLFIGDMGPEGVFADASNPGFIVEVPNGPLACGTTSCTIGALPAFKLTNTTGVIYPDAITTDASGNLFIADGGDGSTTFGSVDVIPAPVATGTLKAISVGTLNQPSSLNIDAANNLYILDAYNSRILVAHLTTTFTVSGNVEALGVNQSGNGSSGITTPLVTPSAAVVWPGASNISIADIAGNGLPVHILTLSAFSAPSVSVTGTASATVNVVNTGNTTATFTGPTYSGPTYCTNPTYCFFFGNNANSYAIAGGCGDTSGNTITVGTVCTETISNPGAGSGAGTYTLNGRTSSTFSVLGNVININGSASGASATLTAPARIYTASATATLKNTGTTTLTITSKTVTNATITGGTCGATLTSGLSCTITYNITHTFTTAVLTVVDTAGTQTGSTFYLPSSSFPAAMEELFGKFFF